MDSRLKAIMNFVPNGSRVADIGTDHGYLAIELIKSNIAEFVIASDKNAKPLAAAQKNTKEADVEGKINLRLGDGLQSIDTGEVNVICIAGMGGALMCNILDASPKVVAKVDKIILQPMNASEKIRQWAADNNFYIEDEDLAEVDNIIYEIFCLSRTFSKLKSTRKENSPLYNKFIETKVNKLHKVVDSMSKSQKAMESDKYLELQERIKKLEELKLPESTKNFK